MGEFPLGLISILDEIKTKRGNRGAVGRLLGGQGLVLNALSCWCTSP